MPVSADTLRALMAAGVTGDALVAVVEQIDADMAAATPVMLAGEGKGRSAGAERQARYRAALKGEVTPSDVTADVTSDVTVASLCKAAPLKEITQTPPSTSLRSVSQPARSERFAEFWSAYPRRSGSNPKQPAEEKFCRLLKASTDPEQLAAEILDGAGRYAASVANADPRFTAQAVTWLNQGRWRDDHSTVLPLGGPRAGPPPRTAPINPRLAASAQLRDYLDERPR